MKKTLQYQYLFLILFSLLVGNFSEQKVEAKSVSWTKTEPSGFIYRWRGYENVDNTDRTSVTSTNSGGWGNALINPNITIVYQADIYNDTTGAKLSDGTSVPIGTILRLSPKSFSSTDISWFGTGYSMDSPNGYWLNGASVSSSIQCANQDDLGTDSSSGLAIRVYVPLSINPPTVLYNMNGTAVLTKLDVNKWRVDGGGSITGTVTFDSTYGKFYYRYADYTYGYALYCTGDSTPLRKRTLFSSPYSCTYGQSPQCSGIEGSAYQLTIPTQTITFNLSAAAPANTAPNAPTITGPTTGAPNTSYSFAFRASDPNGDTVRYGISWDNNTSVDQWLPASGYVASNTSQSTNYSWTTTGAKTFRAQTQDSKGAVSGWTTHTITLSNPVNSPTLNFTINNSTGPLDVALGSNLNLVWSATNVTSCTAYGAGWSSGGSIPVSSSANVTASASDSYIVNCTGANGNISRSITVNLANTLKVCQNSCSSGIQRGNTASTQSFTLATGGAQNLVSCFNPSNSCNDASGNVTSSTTWNETNGNNTVSLSGSNPKVVTGNTGGSENISASYSSQTNNMTVNVSCLPTVSCDNAPGRENYCQSETFTVDNGCGVTLNCNGTKSCNYNWKEVAP